MDTSKMETNKQEYNKIENLNFESLVNKRYKSWSAFCKENNVRYCKTSEQNDRQKKVLDRFVKVKWLDDKEFIIKEIREDIKPSFSKKGKNGRFSDYLEYLIPHLTQNRYMCLGSIMMELGLINFNYLDAKYHNQKILDNVLYHIDLPKFEEEQHDNNAMLMVVNSFFINADFIRTIIKSKLESMSKQGLIKLDIKIKIKVEEQSRFATKQEEVLIDKAEKRALEVLECKTLQDVFLKKKFKDYYDTIKELLSDDYLILDRYYRTYRITNLVSQKGRKPSKQTLTKKKEQFKSEYVKKINENIDSKSTLKTMKFIEKQSSSFRAKEGIFWQHEICNWLLCEQNILDNETITDVEEVEDLPF